MNIYEFLTFPDISNNINAVLFYPQKSYRHSALRESCLKQAPFMAVCQYLNAKIQNKLETKKEKGEKFAINVGMTILIQGSRGLTLINFEDIIEKKMPWKELNLNLPSYPLTHLWQEGFL